MKRVQELTRLFTRCLIVATSCIAWLGLSPVGWANHEHVEYPFDDQNTVGWTSGATTTIPGYSGGVFLGEFSNQTVSLLIMDALPGGDDPDNWSSDRCVALSFDFLTTGEWIGNGGSFFSVTANGEELVLTTFATPGSGWDQSYPSDYPDGSWPAGWGAVEIFGNNAVYHLEFEFPLIANKTGGADIVIDFSATGVGPDSWGLDNVIVDWSNLDPCPDQCPYDLDDNESVGVSDLLSLLADWGPCKGCPADFDENGDVGVPDLLALLANWGPCP